MRQSRTAGRIPGSARRLALTSLGAGLAVAAAAPMASAATVAAAVPPASSDVADSAALGSSATSANAVPVTSAAVQQQAQEAQEAPLTAPEVAPAKAAPAAAWSRLGKLKLYPLAGTGVDPLSNVVETSLGGIPVSTQPVADTFADGLPVADLPVIGSLLGGPLG